MTIRVLENEMKIDDVEELAQEWYKVMIKGTVDIEREKVAVGGDYHMESLELLVKDGSKSSNVWGFNIWFGKDEKLEFDSLVNIKPELENRSRGILDEDVTKRAEEIIHSWIKFN